MKYLVAPGDFDTYVYRLGVTCVLVTNLFQTHPLRKWHKAHFTSLQDVEDIFIQYKQTYFYTKTLKEARLLIKLILPEDHYE